MAEPLKGMFNREYYERLVTEVEDVAPSVHGPTLLQALLHGNADRELNARMRHTSSTLRAHLPADPRKAMDLLKLVAPRMPKNYTALVFADFVGQFGLNETMYALDALKYFTRFGSAEFAVREFFRRDVNGTLKVMRAWAEDTDEHVRRLASEGSRPRLPWSFQLDAVLKDPNLTTPILERLRTDDSLYVRKSVANHLNDHSKGHPEHMLQLLRTWDLGHPHTAWIAKHACRTLIKRGDPEALALFAFDGAVKLRVDDLVIAPAHLQLGGTLGIAFTLVSEVARSQRLVVDYAIHYRKANGMSTRKVFKLKELELGPDGRAAINKRQRIMDFSTRTHHPGEHVVEILVNGKERARGRFVLAR